MGAGVQNKVYCGTKMNLSGGTKNSYFPYQKVLKTIELAATNRKWFIAFSDIVNWNVN